jgi:hypothetical protein
MEQLKIRIGTHDQEMRTSGHSNDGRARLLWIRALHRHQ